jgi:outer membrane receptor protein involved in Fe transport
MIPTGPDGPEIRSPDFRASWAGLYAGLLFAAVLLGAAPATGQDAGDQNTRTQDNEVQKARVENTQADNAGGPIDEMVVTVRKREESPIDVPVAVTPFSAYSMEQLGLTRIGEIARYTPGFSFNTVAGRQPAADRPVVRGVTSIRNGITNTSVASVFVDGVFVGGTIQSAGLYNLERVEILRGPQTALYGRGTYAGAINYVTRRPTDEYEAEVTLTGAEHDTLEANAWVSGPLAGDRWAFFVGAGHNQYGGEWRNTRDGSEVGGTETNDIAGKLYWTPTDNFDASLKLGYQANDDDHFAIYLQPSTLNNCCFRTAQAPRAREYFVGEAQFEDQIELFTDLLNAAGGSGTQMDRRLAALDLNWTLPAGHVLHSVTGYIDDELERGFDSSYAAYDPFPVRMPGSFTQLDKIEQSDVSQELRVSSPSDRPLQWTAGGYYYQGESNEIVENRVFLDAGGNLMVEPNFGPLTDESVKNLAFFGGADWGVGDRWDLSAELRWARDEITVENFTNDGSGQLEDRFNTGINNLTPRLTVTYSFGDATNVYANIAKGTNPGTFNSVVPTKSDGSPDESFRAVDEEALWNYELGAKSLWWDGRATGSVAGYYLDVTDQQLTTIIELEGGGTASIIQNVGRTSVYGLEVEGTVFVTDDLSLSATYAYTDAEIREHIDSDEADLRGSDGSVAETQALGNVAGNTVPRVPEHGASLVVRYERSLSAKVTGYISSDYTYESSKFAQVHNLIETGDSSLVGLRIGFDTGRWETIIWGKNILDDDTPTDLLRYFDRRFGTLPSFPQQGARASSSPRGFGIALPRGRQIGVTARFRF